ncbi:transposase-like protein [Streptacidiphilus sp. MAP12-16]
MLFVDAIQVKIHDGQVANRAIYVVLGATVDGTRDILGLWAGQRRGGAAQGRPATCGLGQDGSA